MKKNSTVKFELLDNLINSDKDTRKTTNIPFENQLFETSTKKIAKNNILISTIIIKQTSVNEILETSANYDDEIYIFEITGKTYINTNITWKVYKNNKQIKEMFEQIKKEISKRDFVDENIIIKCKLVKHYYSNFEIDKNIEKIGEYIVYIYNSTNPFQPQSLKLALKISKTSFTDSTGIKPFEGFAYKKAEPRIMRSILKYLCFPIEYFCFNDWNKRWIVLKNDMISYLNNPYTSIGKNVYWFDEDFEIYPEKDKILTIKNLSRKLVLSFDTRFERDLWKKEIESRVEIKKDELTGNIYHSFTSQKINCGAKWFVDGDSYFSYLFEQLKKAKETVYVTDWFMSPELALVRPINYNNYIGDKKDYKKYLNFSNVQRLMDVFYLLAKRGVKIYILLFCEVKLALAVNSLNAKKVLQNLHENIKVTRHPKGTSSILWSHHEKLVIIDQKIAFVGGLDLCWGRYDTNNHPIVEEENESHTYYYPGSDYSNERQEDFHEVDKFYNEQVNRNRKPRMGWHDIHTMVEGPIVMDIVRHFIERWNDARFRKRNNALVNVGPTSRRQTKINLNKKKSKKDTKLEKEIKKINDIGLSKKPSKTLKSSQINIINKFTKNIEQIKEEENDDEEENEEDEENNDNIINTNSDNKKNLLKKQKTNLINEDDEYPLFKVDSDIDSDLDSNHGGGRFTLFNSIKNKMKDYKNKNTKKLEQSAFLTDDYELMDQNVPMDFKIQALRSVCSWSIGKTLTEHSILEGYYKLIDNSKHYIYIENQFFITKPYSEDERRESGKNLNRLVENEIGLHIRSRIERAYEEKSNFKVFICIPLLPGFSGTPGESSTMNCILKHTYQSISRNKGMSLLEQLRKKMGDEVNNYIFFFSLRNHGTIKEKPVTELVYIHSKLLIVDDEKVLMGSANINDRSMTGYRDSEFAVILEEDKKVQSIMNGKQFTAANYALTLRRHLMAEHMGIKDDNKLLDDPLSPGLWNEMKSRASVNTVIYRDIFDCFPDNKFNNFAKLRDRKKFSTKKEIEKLKEEYKSKSIGIVGHIVEYPIDFLKDEELDIDFFSKENLVPEKNFV